MTWWAWTLLWVVLVAGAGLVFFRIGRSLWGSVSALITELGEAADRLSAVSAGLETLAGRESESEPAIFADPAELRRRRYLTSRGDQGQRRTGGRLPWPGTGRRGLGPLSRGGPSQ